MHKLSVCLQEAGHSALEQAGTAAAAHQPAGRPRRRHGAGPQLPVPADAAPRGDASQVRCPEALRLLLHRQIVPGVVCQQAAAGRLVRIK